MLSQIQLLVFLSLLTVSLFICVFSLNTYVLLYFNRQKRRVKRGKDVEGWPPVTIQIPTYNEKNVIKRTLENCLNIDYPKEKLEIVIVDDSTDETTEVLKQYEAKYHPRIKVIHRSEREGYKAGALNTAMKYSCGEFFMILDADTAPSKGFLKETIPYFLEDEEIGFVQGKIEYINAEDSWLTKSLASTNDWYRTFSQSALSKAGMFLSFLGHGGVFRRSAIEDAGGWESDTITEDMDLSYRVQMKGWRGLFVEEAKCVEEVPQFYPAAVQQYNRHLKGPIQNLRKHCSKILKDNAISILRRFEALVQMAYPLIYPLELLCVALSVLTYLIVPASFLGGFWSSPIGVVFSLFTLVTLPYVSLTTSFSLPMLLMVTASPFLYFLILKRKHVEASRYLGSAFGIALIWNDNVLTGTKALIELIARKKATWIPTPKMGDESKLIASSSKTGEIKRNMAREAILRIISAVLIISSFIIVMQRNFIINAFGLLLPAFGWLASAYLLLK